MDLNSNHKKPYEILVLGRYINSSCKKEHGTLYKRTAVENDLVSPVVQKKARSVGANFHGTDVENRTRTPFARGSASLGSISSSTIDDDTTTLTTNEMQKTLYTGVQTDELGKIEIADSDTGLSEPCILGKLSHSVSRNKASISCDDSYASSRDITTNETFNAKNLENRVEQSINNQLMQRNNDKNLLSASLKPTNILTSKCMTLSDKTTEALCRSALRSNSAELKNEEKDILKECSRRKSLPQHQVICSVPCVLHSRKPPLEGEFLLIQNYFSINLC